MSRTTPVAPDSWVPLNEDGLTLIEVLVSLLLLSLLAAAVFPVVTERVGQREPVRAGQSLAAVGEAIERFSADLGGVLPEDLDDLVNRLDARDRHYQDSGVLRSYDEAMLELWDGPYLDVPLGDGGALVTGFDLPIQDDLVLFDMRTGAPLAEDAEIAAGSILLALRLGRPGRLLTEAQFKAIKEVIDGTGERTGPGTAGSWQQGRFRYEPASDGTGGVGYYLTLPLSR